mmetsp:Transcript_8931/g.12389  ORF Transcript_8931/g.12389 Transcript_8931/m.12389 type:complete len:223 (-) Transcript_8931:175-843(-)
MRMRNALNCWRINNRTMVESTEFKRSVINYYGRAVDVDSNGKILSARCMVSNDVFSYNELTPAHLVKHSTPQLMRCYGLQPSDIDNPRNGVLILKAIEESFDRLDTCFLFNSFSGKLTFKVLRPYLMECRICPSSNTVMKTFGDIDGKELQLPTDSGSCPYKRVLSMHAKYAFARALQYGWIVPTETLDTYFSVSDEDLEEPDFIQPLSWQDMKYDDIMSFI